MIVLDASIMVAWLLNEPAQASRPQLTSILSQETMLVPAHWSAEIGNALLVNCRRGRITMSEIQIMLEDLATFAISPQPAIETEHFGSIIRFAENHGLTFYDAIYVKLADETGSSLATLDDDMRVAAKNLGVAVLPD
ncbi:MAG: type II toxin-antitoxin system VapC family toxin [Rhizobiales bacterium]|nr:type II toxin-antitoxin system VapC family toxin [Hyphomicrobiales bacterium]